MIALFFYLPSGTLRAAKEIIVETQSPLKPKPAVWMHCRRKNCRIKDFAQNVQQNCRACGAECPEGIELLKKMDGSTVASPVPRVAPRVRLASDSVRQWSVAGKVIAQYIINKGTHREHVCKACGLTDAELRLIETGQSTITEQDIALFAVVFKVGIEDFRKAIRIGVCL